MKKLEFPEYLTEYLSKYLPLQMGASINTVKSYRDSFTILLRYCRDEHKIKPEKISIYNLNRKFVENYILWLESKQKCSISTCNHRLTTLQASLDMLLLNTQNT